MSTARCLILAAFLLLLAGPGRAAPPLVLFDQGHGQRFTVEGSGELDLSGLAAAVRAAGYAVRSTTAPLGAGTLEGVQVLVTSGLFVPYRPQEVRAILDFVERGGGLSVMLHVAPTYANLLAALDVLASPGVLYEGENVIGDNPLDFRVTRLQPHPLTAGLEHFSVYGAWAVMAGRRAGGGAILAASSARAWIDADRDRRQGPGEPPHAYGLLVAGSRGSGRFAVFGDDAIFQNRFLDSANRKLADNLVRWLATGAAAL